MSLYRIHRLKETARQQFRWAPHVTGPATAKPKDYEAEDSIEAGSPYQAWQALKDSQHPLHPGDILESETGDLRIYKYIGFEQVQWLLPELRPDQQASVASADPASQAEVRELG